CYRERLFSRRRRTPDNCDCCPFFWFGNFTERKKRHAYFCLGLQESEIEGRGSSNHAGNGTNFAVRRFRYGMGATLNDVHVRNKPSVLRDKETSPCSQQLARR